MRVDMSAIPPCPPSCPPYDLDVPDAQCPQDNVLKNKAILGVAMHEKHSTDGGHVRLLSGNEAAKLAGVDERTLRRLAKDGMLAAQMAPSKKGTPKWLYPADKIFERYPAAKLAYEAQNQLAIHNQQEAATRQEALKEDLSTIAAMPDWKRQRIATTELANADVMGNKLAYAESDVVAGLQWMAANDDTTCEECLINHEAIVSIGPDGMAAEPYPSGAKGVPAHPRCKCDEWPVLKED